MPEFKCNEKPQQQYNSGYCQWGNSIIASLVVCFQPKRAGCQALLHSYKRRSGEMKVRQRQRKSDPYICALTLPASLSHVFAVITYKNSAGHSRNFGKRIDKIGVVIFQPDFHIQFN